MIASVDRPGTAVEWAYCSTWSDGSEHIMRCDSEQQARLMVVQGSPDPTITRRLMRREIITSSWMTVPVRADIHPAPGTTSVAPPAD